MQRPHQKKCSAHWTVDGAKVEMAGKGEIKAIDLCVSQGATGGWQGQRMRTEENERAG